MDSAKNHHNDPSVMPLPPSAADDDGSSSVHPMVSVPEAVRCVLRETARILLSADDPAAALETLSVQGNNSTELHQWCGRILVHDVTMREPGYPPYAASIMDGYALDSRTLVVTEEKTKNNNDDDGPHWTHVVRDKVLTGDAPLTNTTGASPDESISKQQQQQQPPPLPSAYYITTGAPLPPDCDCVVPIEEVTVSKDFRFVQIPTTPRSQSWIRAPGCDLAPGEIILKAGTLLDSTSVGLILQSGQSTVQVRRKITVGVLSTGNELWLPQPLDHDSPEVVDWWQELKPGTIPDVNRPVLLSLLSTTFPNLLQVTDLGTVRDDNVDAVVERIQEARRTCDVIVTTGGISVGETDILEHVLVERLQGQLQFGRLHMKPGKPATLVVLPETKDTPRRLVFALPGNPVSAVVCTHLLVGPCLQLLTHGPPTVGPTDGSRSVSDPAVMLQRIVDQALVHGEVETVLEHDIPLDMERPEYHRVIIDPNNSISIARGSVENATMSSFRWNLDSSSHSGDRSSKITVRVQSTGVQRSSRLISMHQANGLMVLPQGTPDHPVARAGERYTVLLLPSSSQSQYNLPVHQSHHLQLAPAAPPAWKVAVIRFLPDELMVAALPTPDQLPQRIVAALSSPQLPGSSVVQITEPGVQIYTGAVEDLYERAVLTQWQPTADDPTSEPTTAETAIPTPQTSPVDLILILGPKYHGAMRRQLQLAQSLQQRLVKLSPTLAQQVRRGAAIQDPVAGALWDVVVGYACPETCEGGTTSSSNSDAGALVVLLPEEGVDGALSHVCGLLKHGLTMARGAGHHYH